MGKCLDSGCGPDSAGRVSSCGAKFDCDGVSQCRWGGDIDQSTPDSISQFLAKHEDVRKQITPLCTQKKANAPADWTNTDEGKVCAGNARANFFGKPALKSDGVPF
jgi:hypothetical protein